MHSCSLVRETPSNLSVSYLQILLFIIHSIWSYQLSPSLIPAFCVKEQPHRQDLWTYPVPLLRQLLTLLLFFFFPWKICSGDSCPLSFRIKVGEEGKDKRFITLDHGYKREIWEIWKICTWKMFMRRNKLSFSPQKQKWGNWRQWILSLEKEYGFFYQYFLFLIFYYWQKIHYKK